MKKRGTGYACMFYGTGYGNGFPDESRADVELKEDGSIVIYVEATEVGQGARNVMRQICSESVNTDVDNVTIINSDTKYTKDSGTAAASRQTYNTGNAVMIAGKKLHDNILKALNKENIDLHETITKDILQRAYKIAINNGIELKCEGYFKADTTSVDMETGQGNPYWPYSFGIQKAVVEVDDETGKVDVLELTACHDSGKIINPDMAEAQIQGGSSMGLGYALMEEIEFNNGIIKNKNFSDYIIPTSLDVPFIKTAFNEDVEMSGPFGAKGLGEPALIPTAPAILNAIYDAVGVRLYEIPATCERVLKAIKNKEGQCQLTDK